MNNLNNLKLNFELDLLVLRRIMDFNIPEVIFLLRDELMKKLRQKELDTVLVNINVEGKVYTMLKLS